MRRVSISSPKDKNGMFSSNRRSSLPGQMPISRLHSSKCGTVDNDLAIRNGPLPRIRRINESECGSPTVPKMTHGNSTVYSPVGKKTTSVIHGSNSSVSSPRRYPTHQPQFNGLGILPSVRLNKTPRAVLSEQNSTMLNSSVTVKVAPPDVLKAPTPVFVQVSSKKPEPPSVTNSCDPESVLSALREKRKRNLGEDDERVLTSPDSKQVAKRRRQLEEELTNGEMAYPSDRIVRDQTKLPSKRPAASDEDWNDESQKRLKPERRRAVGVKNALEASFSSSKRWMEKSRDLLNRSRDSSLSRSHRSFSAEPYMFSQQTSRNTSQSNTPRHSITLEEDVVMTSEVGNLSNTSTPIPGTSGRTTPLTDGDQSDSVSTLILATPKNKPLALKEGSTKRRLMPSSTSTDDYARVPRLRYQLTSDDFEKDRKTDIDRVKQLMDDVDEEYNKQNNKKKGILNNDSVNTAAETTSSISQPVVASSTSSSTQPIVGGFSLSTSTANKPVVSIAPVTSLNITTASQISNSSQQIVNSTPGVSQPVSSNLAVAPTSVLLQPGTRSTGSTGLSTAVTLSSSVKNPDQESSTLKELLNDKTNTASPIVVATSSQNLPSPTTASVTPEVKFKPVFGAPPTQTNSAALSTVTSQNSTSNIGGFKFSGSIGVSPVSTGAGLSFGNMAATTAVASTTPNNGTSLISGIGVKAPATAGYSFGQSVTTGTALPSSANSGFTLSTNLSTPKNAAAVGFNFSGNAESRTNVSSSTGVLQQGINQPTASTATESVLNLSKPKENHFQTGSILKFGQNVQDTSKTNPAPFSFGGGVKSEATTSMFSTDTKIQAQSVSSTTTTPFGTPQQPLSSSTTNTGMFGASNPTSQPHNSAPPAPFQFGNAAQSPTTNSQPSALFSFGTTQNKSESKPAGAVPTFGSSSSTTPFGLANSVSGSFGAPTSNTPTSGFGPTFGATTSSNPQPAPSFNFGGGGVKSPSNASATPGFGATAVQHNGFTGQGNGQQTVTQSKGYNFATSAPNNSFNFGQSQTPTPAQFGSPNVPQTPSFGGAQANVFTVGTANTAPKPRNIKTASRRRGPKR